MSNHEIMKCKGCGAITITLDGKTYSMRPETYRKKFGVARVPRAKIFVGSCDYCVNHYGVELCACGSGLPYERCEGGYPECGKPMQSIEEGIERVNGGWLA